MNEKAAFFGAIRNGDLKTVEKLIIATPELLKVQDERGSTPLILAAYYNHITLVELLLNKGLTADEKDGAGNTALMGVCFKGYTEIAKILIKAGAAINHRNSMGATCLIYAATFKRLEIATLLLENGADLDIKDARGQKALDHAKMSGAEPLIKLLEKS